MAVILLLLPFVGFGIWLWLILVFTRLLKRPDQKPLREFGNVLLAFIGATVVVLGAGFAILAAICSGSHF